VCLIDFNAPDRGASVRQLQPIGPLKYSSSSGGLGGTKRGAESGFGKIINVNSWFLGFKQNRLIILEIGM
jgi:hypothetical protein